MYDKDSRRYKIVSITRMVPVEMFVLVSSTLENPDSSSALNGEWDIEILRPVDYRVDSFDMQERIEEFGIINAQELDNIANDSHRGTVVEWHHVEKIRKYGF